MNEWMNDTKNDRIKVWRLEMEWREWKEWELKKEEGRGEEGTHHHQQQVWYGIECEWNVKPAKIEQSTPPQIY